MVRSTLASRSRVERICTAATWRMAGAGGWSAAAGRARNSRAKTPKRIRRNLPGGGGSPRGGPPAGGAPLTRGYRLPVKHVIHTAGPVWQGGQAGEEELLARCYRSCFDLLVEHGLKSIAFPAISTGVYGFPMERA